MVATALHDRVMAVLQGVLDPEVPVVSVVELGIVREVRDNPPTVVITPTYTGCPATDVIKSSIRVALDASSFQDVAIETTLTPPWSTDWISDAGREKLRAYGIAPPPHSSKLRSRGQAPACPRCNSANTEEISRFGSTPCKALWRCLACAEPFDHFKCH
jgi:ring-1,2-phenylacetyl-CoA epoxidase subunit PaaD